MIHPAAEGTGIIAGGPARRILELAGFKNILAKRYGSTNIITNAYAAMEALKSYAHLSVESAPTPKKEAKPAAKKEAAPAAKKKAPAAKAPAEKKAPAAKKETPAPKKKS